MFFFWVSLNLVAQTGMKGRGQHSAGHELSKQIVNRELARKAVLRTSDSELRGALPPLVLALNKACKAGGTPTSIESFFRQALDAVTDAMVSQIKSRRSDFPPCEEVELMVEDLLAATLIEKGEGRLLTDTSYWKSKSEEAEVSMPIRDMTLLEDEEFQKSFSHARFLWKQSRIQGTTPEERRRLHAEALLQLQLFTLRADARSHLAH